MTTLRIGTRGSRLALWQANAVARRLAERAGVASEVVVIRTAGDEASGPPDPPAAAANVKAQFVKEIEDALLTGAVDLAVHSSKDLAAALPEGLVIPAVLPREDPRDAVLLPRGERVADLDALTRRLAGAPRFGTSSVRRTAQLTSLFPGARFVPLRGNVDTRVRKLDAGDCDAAILAVAGLNRLDAAARIALALPIAACVPAPGQGIVAIEMREDRKDVAAALDAIGDAAALDALTAERAVVGALGGNCQMPLGAHAQIEGDRLIVTGAVISLDGGQVVRAERHGARRDAAATGAALAASLVSGGALKILGA